MNIPTTDNYKEWIEYYVNELHWSLMPVHANKIPVLSGWDKLREEPLSIDMLLYWVEKRGFQLGALTGDKLFYVIDDDYPKHSDRKRPAETDLESTVVAKTQNGGLHYYFKPFGMANKQDILLPTQEKFAIDLRGNNGQVLIPPFGNYKWIKPPTKEALIQLPATPPPAILNFWNSKRVINQDYTASDDFLRSIGASDFRDPVLFNDAISLFQRHYKEPSLFPKSLIIAHLNEVNSYFNPPKENGVVEKVFKQAEKYMYAWAVAHEYIAPPDTTVEYKISKISDEDLATVKHYPTLKTGLGNLDRGGIPPGMNVIVGQSGSGKSWFVNHLIKTAWTLNQKRSVLFSLEMDFEGIKKRMIQSFAGVTLDEFVFGADVSRGIELLKDVDPLIIDYTQSDSKNVAIKPFLKRVHELYQEGYRVIMFDHFHEIPGMTVNEKNQQLSETWADAFKLIRNTYDDLWMFVLAQSTKEGYKKKILTKEYISGSSALINKCDFIITLNRTEDPDKVSGTDFATDKLIKIWVDKSRRTSADKYMTNATLKSTGEFVDTALSEIEELVDADPDDEKQMSW
jgi:GTPase SAR1 family protein